FVVFFQECAKNIEEELLLFFTEVAEKKGFETVVLQRRYLHKAPSVILYGSLKQNQYVYENGLKYELSLMEHQNIGFFGDMKVGREFIAKEAKGKNILNLFSYTCSFSVVAIKNEAKQIINVDMSKQALSVGRTNHQINDLNSAKAKFLPYNILKSWGRIKKYAPYDLIIIDPPSYQKGSFEAAKDYAKIVKRLNELASVKCTVLACLNDPFLEVEFLKNIFKEHAPQFIYAQQLESVPQFKSLDASKGLKNLVFRRVF
ncbi:MAG: class I SAM-dependent methyltransferase, partial [Arcobacteraceae bacterium]